MPVLIVEHNNARRGAVLPRRVLIGRQSMNQLVIDHRSVSRMHAWLDGDGVTYTITDCHSRTGTRINGLPIYPGKPLEDGDRIEIGPARLIFFTDPEVPEDVEPFALSEPVAGPDDGKGVRFDCRRCHSPLWAPSTHVGESVGCGYCKKAQRVPPPAANGQAGTVPTGLSVNALVVAAATSERIDVAGESIGDVVVARPAAAAAPTASASASASASRRPVSRMSKTRAAVAAKPAVAVAFVAPKAKSKRANGAAPADRKAGDEQRFAASLDLMAEVAPPPPVPLDDVLHAAFPGEDDVRTLIISASEAPASQDVSLVEGEMPEAIAVNSDERAQTDLEPIVATKTAALRPGLSTGPEGDSGERFAEASTEADPFAIASDDMTAADEAPPAEYDAPAVPDNAWVGGEVDVAAPEPVVIADLGAPSAEGVEPSVAFPAAASIATSSVILPVPAVHDHARGAARAVCGVCQSNIEPGEERAKCPKCGLDFHAECWAENYGCSAYGCTMVNALAPPEAEASPNAGAEESNGATVDESDAAAPRRVPWEYVILAAAVASVLIGAISFGVPSLLALGASLYYLWREPSRRRDPVPLLGAGLAAIGIASGAVVSYFLYFGG